MSESQSISDHVEIRSDERLAELRRQFEGAQIPMMTYIEGNAAEDIQRHFNEMASRGIVDTAMSPSIVQDASEKEDQ